MNTKICFSKRTGILLSLVLVVLGAVFIIAQLPGTSTSTNAKAVCPSTMCSVGGNKCLPVDTKNSGLICCAAHMGLKDRAWATWGASCKGNKEDAGRVNADTVAPANTKTKADFFAQYKVKMCEGVLTGGHIFKSLGANPKNVMLPLWSKECAAEYGRSNREQCYGQDLGLAAGFGYPSVGYYSSMKCDDKSGGSVYCCPKPCYAVDTQDPGYVTDGFGSLVGMFPTRVICVMK